jgi:pimeloyl-ACP methyl ester carboxylesterase
MTMSTIYKSAEGRQRFLELYDEAQQRAGVPFDERTVDTRFGPTHLLITGPEEGPPVLVIQGGNSINFETLKLYLPLADHFRLYAPDTVGHPGKSAETRLSIKDLSYGQWAADVVEALGLGALPFLGTSYGGSITLCTAAYAPQLISQAVLVVSASIAQTSMFNMMSKIIWPLVAYQAFGGRDRLLRLIHQMTPEPGEDTITVCQAAFDHLKQTRLLPPFRPEQLEEFKAPTLVLAAERDVFSPCDQVIRRSRELIPNLVAVEVLAGSHHIPSAETQKAIISRIREFLSEP